MKTLARLAAAVLVAATLAVRVPALADEPAPERSARAAAFEALAARLDKIDGLPVIVRLRVAFLPEGELSQTPEVGDQRAEIAQAQNAVERALAGTGASHLRKFQFIPFLALNVDAAALEALRRSPWVESVVEDVPEFITLAESTALIGAATPSTGAWAQGFTGAGQTLAILDTGVDSGHPFLAGKVVAEACFSNANGAGGQISVCPNSAPTMTGPGAARPCNVEASDPLRQCDHGTHVAGIAAGKAYAGQPAGPFSGVAPDAVLIAVQVFTRFTGSFCGAISPCYGTFPSDQVAAMNFVYGLRGAHNVAAVNLSLGGGGFSAQAECDGAQSATGRKAAIDLLRSAGIATVAASGNNGFTNSLNAPGCISSAVSVGSVGEGSGGAAADVVSAFSNSAPFLSLLAPGQWINSSVPGGFANYQGTSMATPHVAGAWAVLKQAKPAATVDEILNALRATGQPITDTRSGAGNRVTPRLQLDGALRTFLPVLVEGPDYDFANAIIDLPVAGTVTLRNRLGIPITIQSVTVTGQGFALAGGSCTPGLLGADQTCQLVVMFAPPNSNGFAGNLALAYVPVGGPTPLWLNLNLTGRGQPLCPGNVLSNSNFEYSNSGWAQSDSLSGAALPIICTGGSCRASGAGPASQHNGNGWAWLGGYTTGAPGAVTQTLTQSVVIPAGTASLQFNFRISRADAGTGADDRFTALMDGAPLFVATAAEQASYAEYRLIRLDLSPYATGLPRTLTFSATTTTAALVNFNVDEAAICSPAFYPVYLPAVSR